MYNFDKNTLMYLLEKLKSNLASQKDFDLKVDIEEGKSLTDNDFSNNDKVFIENKFTRCESRKDGDNIVLDFFNGDVLVKSCEIDCGYNSDVMVITSTKSSIIEPESELIIPIAFVSTNLGNGVCHVNIKNGDSETSFEFNDIPQGKSDIHIGLLEPGINEIELFIIDSQGYESNHIKINMECKNESQYTVIVVDIPEDNYTLQLISNEIQILDDGYVDWGDGSNSNVSAINIMNSDIMLGDFDNQENEPLLEDYPLYDENNNLIGYNYEQYYNDHLIYESNVSSIPRNGIIMLADPGTSSHTYDNAGRYIIKGKFTFGTTEPSESIKACLKEVRQFSDLGTIELANAFYNCRLVQKINFKGIDSINVTDMRCMLYRCYELIDLNLSSLKTDNVTYMSHMFSGCKKLESFDISHFNTKSLLDMSYMFGNPSAGEGVIGPIIGIENLDVSNVTNMTGAFSQTKLTSLDLSKWNTENVNEMQDLFSASRSLTSINMNNWDTSNVINMLGMFNTCNSLIELNLNHFNTSNVTTMQRMFYDCYGLTSLDLSNFVTTNVTNMNNMFYGCKAVTTLNLSNWNTSKVTNMGGMFNGCNNLTSLNLNHFDMSNVTDTNSMFSECKKLQTLNINNWNITNKLISLHKMFYHCNALTELNINNWNVSNVTGMGYLFNGCYSLTTLDLSNWDTSKVTNMNMAFRECSSLTTLDISNFDTSKVTNMEWMFYCCSSLTSLDLSSFNTSNVIDMTRMFENCHALTTLNLSNFNVSKVINFGESSPFISGNLLANITSPKNISSSFTIQGCPVLSKASIIDIINNLSDFASAGILTTAAITLPVRFATELSASEQGEIIRKGWNLSFV